MKTHSSLIQRKSTSNSSTYSSGKGSFFPSSYLVQPKLMVGQPNDKYEQEADNVAEQVVQRKAEGNFFPPISQKISPLNSSDLNASFFPSRKQIQPKCSACEAKEETLQKKEEEIQEKKSEESIQESSEQEIQTRQELTSIDTASSAEALSIQASSESTDTTVSTAIPPLQLEAEDNSTEKEELIQEKCDACGKEHEDPIQKSSEASSSEVSSGLESTLSSSKGGGSPLPEDTRTQMESSIGADFSDVRVHTDSSAVQMNRDLGAQAFTHGSDIYFNEGKYDTGSQGGQKLLAHELTHTVQQGGAPAVQAYLGEGLVNATGNFISSGVRSVGNAVSGAAETVSETVKGVAQYGKEAIISMVAAFSPSLAGIIRMGPFNYIKKLLSGFISNWIKSLTGGLTLKAAFGQFINWLSGPFDDIKAVLEGGDPCTIFGIVVNAIRNMVFKLMESKFVGNIMGRLSRLNGIMTAIGKGFLAGNVALIGGIWQGIKGTAGLISSGIRLVRENLSSAWSTISGLLGFSQGDQSSVLEWIKGIANTAWEGIKAGMMVGINGLQKFGSYMYTLTGLKASFQLISAAERVYDMISWLWKNRNKPNLVELAAKDKKIGKTGLPNLLKELSKLKSKASSVLNKYLNWFVGLHLQILSLVESITGLPILSTLKPVFSRFSESIKELGDWLKTNVPKFIDGITKGVTKLYNYLRPLLSIIVWIGIAIANPPLFPIIVPMILGGAVWLLVPDCYKAPIINLILDIMIKALRIVPDVPMLGPLWSILKPGVVEFLVKIREKPDGVKVSVINKIVEMFLFSGVEFVAGFVVGMLQGILEALFGPFILLYYLGKGLYYLVSWMSKVGNQLFGDGRPAPSLFGGGGSTPEKKKSKKKGPKECQDETKKNENAENPSSDLETVKDVKGINNQHPPNPPLAEAFVQTASQIMGSVRTIRANMSKAIGEFMAGGGGMSFNTLQEKLGSLWAGAQSSMKSKGGKLADCFMATLSSSSAQKLGGEKAYAFGSTLGWLAGTIVTEIILLLISAGMITVAKGALKPIEWLAKAGDKIMEVFMAAFKVFKPLLAMLRRLVPSISKGFGSMAKGALQRVGKAMENIMTSLAQFFAKMPFFKLTDDFAAKLAQGTIRQGGEAVVGGGARLGKEAVENLSERGSREAGEELGGELAEKASKETSENLSERSNRELIEKGNGKTPIENAKAVKEVNQLGPMNQETREMLVDNPEMRKLIGANQDIAHFFRKCKSPCYPPEMRPLHMQRLRQYLDGMEKEGIPVDDFLINDFLYHNRNNLDKATSRFVNPDIPLIRKVPNNFEPSRRLDLEAAFPDLVNNSTIGKLLDDGVPPRQIQDIFEKSMRNGVEMGEMLDLLQKVPKDQRQAILGMLSLADNRFDETISQLRRVNADGAWDNFASYFEKIDNPNYRWVRTSDGRVVEIPSSSIEEGTLPGTIVNLNGERVMYMGKTDEVGRLTSKGGEMNTLIFPDEAMHTRVRVDAGDLTNAPSFRGGRPGHAMEKHGVTWRSCEEVLNAPDRVFTGFSEGTGRPVDVYWQRSPIPDAGVNEGRVVITVRGNKNQVITAYGERGFATRGSVGYVNPGGWANSPSFVEL
ncbi:MAG: DUF4157 domain-containing protein [Bacteroidia bacterium]|nr:DUF4157 domain-containing protein [Bacteroidia bacterium]